MCIYSHFNTLLPPPPTHPQASCMNACQISPFVAEYWFNKACGKTDRVTCPLQHLGGVWTFTAYLLAEWEATQGLSAVNCCMKQWLLRCSNAVVQMQMQRRCCSMLHVAFVNRSCAGDSTVRRHLVCGAAASLQWPYGVNFVAASSWSAERSVFLCWSCCCSYYQQIFLTPFFLSFFFLNTTLFYMIHWPM